MIEQFIDKRFSASSLAIIEQANAILREYDQQSLVLTLRQLYYQFVSRGLMPNKQTEYKRLGTIISDARLAGMVDWDMVEDRARHLRDMSKWESPVEIIEAVAQQYREDIWRNQRWRPEVWIEKDALSGVIELHATTCACPTSPVAVTVRRAHNTRPANASGAGAKQGRRRSYFTSATMTRVGST
jgi:hypothetical protein